MVIVCLVRLLSASNRSAHTSRLLVRHWLHNSFSGPRNAARGAACSRMFAQCIACRLHVLVGLAMRCPHVVCTPSLVRLPIVFVMCAPLPSHKLRRRMRRNAQEYVACLDHGLSRPSTWRCLDRVVRLRQCLHKHEREDLGDVQPQHRDRDEQL